MGSRRPELERTGGSELGRTDAGGLVGGRGVQARMLVQGQGETVEAREQDKADSTHQRQSLSSAIGKGAQSGSCTPLICIPPEAVPPALPLLRRACPCGDCPVR